jgi:hypothetical protein
VVVDEGETFMDTPVLFPVTGVVQPAFVYHFHEAPLPSVPPDAVRVEEPEQMLVGFAVAPVGVVDWVLTVRITDDIVVLPQVPSART